MKITNVLENYWGKRSYRETGNIGIVFISEERPIDKGDILGDFQWRRQVNYSKDARNPELLALVKEQFPEMTRLVFSRKAGCKMCPCSPGLVVKGPIGIHPTTKAVWVE